ncbi:hypothetical protein A1O1_02282 [Capronia coronata CBS 617.96]|uniref:Uncharacterized protein n=1 Tax=Capronia coronata CBS 617.96 TaxID=1182541 RepID=W9ZHE7_9EURO|nr:uncharacterized protein A1O1_02282 [Capronia coronata CBS 617.96]EXJ93889.1 hypothetical protein A1O1_02282 [Capronia coronata CBS 617.96]
MPTNRPFFANFFSAFRARTNPTFQAKSSTAYDAVSQGSLVASAHVSTTNATVTSSGTRSIAARSAAETSTTPQQQHASLTSPTKPNTSTAPLPFSANPSSHRYASPLSRSPGTSSPGGPLSHPHSSHTNTNMSMSPPGASTPMTRGRQRRGSDSSNSSGGFIDALGPEKWYIGGRNAAGEETFYKLGLVTGGTGRRVRSLDRLSL